MHSNKQLDLLKIKNAPIYQNDKFVIDTNKGIQESDYLIDGTGGGIDISKTSDKFLQSMLKQDIAKINTLGGIQICPFSYNVVNDITSNIFAIGQVGKGSLFATNAFWFNSKVSQCIAKVLMMQSYKNKKELAK